MNPDLEDAGGLVSAGLAASDIERASWRRHDDAHPAQNCGNCRTQLLGAYCHACGQASYLHRSLLHLDAKGWRTLPLLVAHPGRLTRRYIDGQRTRYVSPLALFLFTVFLMFFVASLTSGSKPSSADTNAQHKEVKTDVGQTLAEANAEVKRATAALAEARRTGEGDDVIDAETDLAAAQANQRITARTARPLEANLANPHLFLYKLENTAYKFSFMLIPISLPFLWLLFIGRRDITVYDHVVFSLYSLSFMSLLFIAALLLGAVGMPLLAPLLVIFIPPLHMFLQLRETYRLGTFAALWRTAALLCVAGTAFVLFLSFVFMLTLHRA